MNVQKREIDGQRLFVVDGLFDPGFVKLLYLSLVRFPYTLTDYDTEETRQHLHWKSDLIVDEVATHPLMRSWYQSVTTKCAELMGVSELTVLRIYCNNVQYGDHQTMHTDTDRANGVTGLYFANAEWHEDWQGETIFYDRSADAHFAVAPQPGRLLVFPSTMLHRSGVPSRKCFKPRLSVAFKLLDQSAAGRA